MKPRVIRPTIKRIWAVAGGIIVAMAISIWGYYVVSQRPVDKADTSSVSFNLPSGEKVTATAERLEDAGLIRSGTVFIAYVGLHGVRSQLQAGNYSLSKSHSVADIAAILSQGRIKTNLLIIPEGKSVAEITELAVEKGLSRREVNAAIAAKYKYDFLPGGSLEGYLFPDSYQVDDKTSAKSLVTEMLENFQAKVPGRYTKLFARHGLSLHQGLTIASIVEKEVAKPEERPLVAQVMLKRLDMGMRLETDPTVDYAASIGDDRYNTYKHAGLPPGPIASPGLSAMDAVVSPAKTSYLYFVTGKDGVTRFSETFEQHRQFISRYGVSTR